MRDKLFDKQLDIADFQFDDDVVKVFDDMVRRSVPGYDSMIQMIGLITESKEDHLKRLRDCGFMDASCFFQCLNFVSFLSVK